MNNNNHHVFMIVGESSGITSDNYNNKQTIASAAVFPPQSSHSTDGTRLEYVDFSPRSPHNPFHIPTLAFLLGMAKEREKCFSMLLA
jgi:hypothetical protein